MAIFSNLILRLALDIFQFTVLITMHWASRKVIVVEHLKATLVNEYSLDGAAISAECAMLESDIVNLL